MFGWYFYCLRNYFTFSGRASRKEFWSFFFVNLIVLLILCFLFGNFQTYDTHDTAEHFYTYSFVQSTGLPASIYSLFVLFPSLAVTTRRIHDRDHTGWWVFWGCLFQIFNIVVLIFTVLPSLGPNRYGLRAPESPNDVVPPFNPYSGGPFPNGPSNGGMNFNQYQQSQSNPYQQTQQNRYYGNQNNPSGQQSQTRSSRNFGTNPAPANDPSFSDAEIIRQTGRRNSNFPLDDPKN